MPQTRTQCPHGVCRCKFNKNGDCGAIPRLNEDDLCRYLIESENEAFDEAYGHLLPKGE